MAERKDTDPKLTTAQDAKEQGREPTAAENEASRQEAEKSYIARQPARRHNNPNESDFYKVSAGFTSTRGVHQHGEVVSHEEMGEGFKALHPDEQAVRFGRVMYEPVDVDEETRRRFGLEGLGPRLGFTSPQQDREAEQRSRPAQGEVTDPGQLNDLPDNELWEMARLEGLEFPREAPRRTVQGALAKKLREEKAELDKRTQETKTEDETE